jgi:hypothetical protein
MSLQVKKGMLGFAKESFTAMKKMRDSLADFLDDGEIDTPKHLPRSFRTRARPPASPAAACCLLLAEQLPHTRGRYLYGRKTIDDELEGTFHNKPPIKSFPLYRGCEGFFSQAWHGMAWHGMAQHGTAWHSMA